MLENAFKSKQRREKDDRHFFAFLQHAKKYPTYCSLLVRFIVLTEDYLPSFVIVVGVAVVFAVVVVVVVVVVPNKFFQPFQLLFRENFETDQTGSDVIESFLK